tara:strand:- start:1108 stop:2001 length:894 start_codon:yes stop_codon:yes gene_type:complete
MTGKNFEIINMLKIIRPYQWVKNILVFTPLLMSHNFASDNLILSAKAFVIFSLMASSIYVINDIIDLKSDQNHPFKKYRPLAAKLITVNNCKILVLILLVLSAVLLLNVNKEFIMIIISYFILSNLYTFFIKRIIIIDLLTLSLLYTSRILGGGYITDISISSSLFLFSVFFFTSLAAVKRLTEIINILKFKKTIIYGRGYTTRHKKMIYWIAILTGWISILVLIFHINSPEIIKQYSFPNILWIICFVMLFWISRIIYVSSKGKIKDDPIVYAISDKISYLCLAIILFIFLLGITI